jgi:hypothetical protein
MAGLVAGRIYLLNPAILAGFLAGLKIINKRSSPAILAEILA